MMCFTSRQTQAVLDRATPSPSPSVLVTTRSGPAGVEGEVAAGCSAVTSLPAAAGLAVQPTAEARASRTRDTKLRRTDFFIDGSLMVGWVWCSGQGGRE